MHRDFVVDREAGHQTASEHGIVQADPRPGMVELGPGYLDAELVPTDLIGKWAAQSLHLWGARALAYGADAGPWPLRGLLAARAASSGPAHCLPENIMTTGGTSAALDLLAVRFAREGRMVLTESLSYDLGRLIFTGRGVRTVAVPGPADDLDAGLFRRAATAAHRATGVPPAIYLIPTFHNPTGRVLSAERRGEILAVAQHTGSLVIEDQAYADLGYSVPPPPLWHHSDDRERVITLYSFAKCLAPGLRIGWLAGGSRTVAELAADPARRSGGGPSHFAAMLILAAFRSGQFDAHIGALRDGLRLRRDVIVGALAGRLPAGWAASRPAGGFFLWVGLPGGVADRDLLRIAEQHGVSFAMGSRFGASPAGARLCFAAAGPEQLRQGAARFLLASRSCQLHARRHYPQ